MSRAVHVANWSSSGIVPACGARPAMPSVTLNHDIVTCERCRYGHEYFISFFKRPAVELDVEKLQHLIDIKQAPGYTA